METGKVCRAVGGCGLFRVLCLFALQGTVHMSDMFSATVQGMVRRMFNTGFQLDVPVFFVKADLTRDVSVRVGRIQLPVFMSSDYRQVGYSNTWVRPPIEVYGQIPSTAMTVGIFSTARAWAPPTSARRSSMARTT
jgi:hypothetical protein